MKKLFLSFVITLSVCFVYAQPQDKVRYEVIVEQAQPTLTEQQILKAEQAKHPRLAAAINELRSAYAELQKAPDDFGGHKAQAITDTQQAIISLRKALYYRVYSDIAK